MIRRATILRRLYCCLGCRIHGIIPGFLLNCWDIALAFLFSYSDFCLPCSERRLRKKTRIITSQALTEAEVAGLMVGDLPCNRLPAPADMNVDSLLERRRPTTRATTAATTGVATTLGPPETECSGSQGIIVSFLPFLLPSFLWVCLCFFLLFFSFPSALGIDIINNLKLDRC